MSPPIISVLYYHKGWPDQLLNGLRSQGIDNEIVWVNNLPDNDVRANYLDENTTVIPGSLCRSHGGGIDAGVRFCRNRGDTHALHVEPDCTVASRNWYEGLLRSAENGASLAGPFIMGSGLIHPCVSMWKLNDIHGSFTIQPRTQMPDPAFFDAMGNIKQIVEFNGSPLAIWMLTAFWDCGLLNAYEARRKGRSSVTSWDGITHHWNGREKVSP